MCVCVQRLSSSCFGYMGVAELPNRTPTIPHIGIPILFVIFTSDFVCHAPPLTPRAVCPAPS